MTAILAEIGSTFRPAAKKLIKGGLFVTSTFSEFAGEAGKEFHDLVTEARTELNTARTRPQETTVKSEGIYQRLVNAGHSVCASAATVASTANLWFAALLVWLTGETEEKAEQQVKKFEGSVKHFAKDLTEEECGNVIETLIVAAVV